MRRIRARQSVKREADALDQRPRHVPAVMGQAQADPGGAGIRVEVRRALAGQVGQEHHAAGAGLDLAGVLDQQVEGVATALPARRRARQHGVAVPAQGAACRQA